MVSGLLLDNLSVIRTIFERDPSLTISLAEHESRLVGWISDIVEEGRTSGDDDLWPQAGDPSSCDYLGFAVVKLWARLIRGNEQWAILKVIGDGLDIYANTCEQRLVNSNLDVNTT